MKKQVQLLLLIIATMLALLFLQDWQRWFLDTLNVGLALMVIFIAIIIFLENRHPSRTMTWLMVLALFPVVGFIAYISFGQSYRKKRIFRKRAYLDEQFAMESQAVTAIADQHLTKVGEHQQKTLKLAQRLGQYPVSFASQTDILTNGEKTFTEIINALKKAKHHIHLEYYIVRHDELGKQIKKILIEKAAEGVEIRFLYDAVGSWKLSQDYIKELHHAGVEMVPFFPVKMPFLNNKINFRNHRKIVVIDGETGFIGGLNVGDEYLGKHPGFGFWRDTHLRVTGETVKSLQMIFLQDWYYMTGHSIGERSYFQPERLETTEGAVQMVSSSPDDEWEVIKHLFFSMITSAKHSIWVASPYLIPDDDILSALKVAALSGVDVKVLVPKKPDKRIVFHASRSYYPELLEAGVKIYEYTKGFMHSKVIIVDHELASIGTSNMDMRSFHLNFEVNAFLYRTDSIKELMSDFINDLKHANSLEYETFKKRPLLTRIIESTSRLLSPLL